MQALKENKLNKELEILTPEQQYNEYVMTALRTMWGIDFLKIKNMGRGDYFIKNIKTYMEQGLVFEKNGNYTLTDKGKFLADGIAAGLFL